MFSPVEFIESPAYIRFKLAIFRHAGYTPSPAQLKAHMSLERNLILCAGARFGKSLFAAAEVLARLMLPGQRIWLIGPQYSLAEKEFYWILDLLSRIVLPDHGDRNLLSFCHKTGGARGSQKISTPWGSFVETKTTEKEVSLWGESLSMAVLCEAAHIKKGVYDKIIRGRLGDLKGSLLATSTPDKSSGLLFHFNNRGLSNDWPTWKSFNYGVMDNPTFSRAEIEAARRELPKHIFDQQYGGLFLDPREKVIETFFANEALIDEIPAATANCPFFISIKRAHNNPTVLLMVAVDRAEKQIYVLGEVYNHKTRLVDIQGSIDKWAIGRNFGGFITDFQDYNVQQELRTLGYRYSEVKPDKSKTCEEMAKLQYLRNFFTEDYLKIFEGCTSVIADLENYRYPEKLEDDDKKQKEVPKTSIHKQGVDALANTATFMGRYVFRC